MTERIKKTPIKEALAALDIVWDNAQQRLDDMGPRGVLARMPGAVYCNSSHPFRDKLHIEGMMKGLEFALTGRSEAVKYWLDRAEDLQKGEDLSATGSILNKSRVPFIKFVTRLVGRLLPMQRSNQ